MPLGWNLNLRFILRGTWSLGVCINQMLNGIPVIESRDRSGDRVGCQIIALWRAEMTARVVAQEGEDERGGDQEMVGIRSIAASRVINSFITAKALRPSTAMPWRIRVPGLDTSPMNVCISAIR